MAASFFENVVFPEPGQPITAIFCMETYHSHSFQIKLKLLHMQELNDRVRNGNGYSSFHQFLLTSPI